MADMTKPTRTKTKNNKIVEYKEQGNIAFQLLVKGEDLHLDLKNLMTYPLTSVPHCIGTADGYFAKTDKSKGLHHLTSMAENEDTPTRRLLVVEDGNASFYCMKDVPNNFCQIGLKLFDMLPKNEDIVFSTDMYVENSIKAMERNRRGCSEKRIIQSEMTKKPPDWKAFLANDENKQQFIKLLCDIWSSDIMASKLHGRKVIYVCEGQAFLLTSDDGITTQKTEVVGLKSSQEETDSRVVLYCMYAQDNGYEYVCVRSPDSDIFFILLNYALQISKVKILFDTGFGNKRRLINVSEIASGFTQQHCTALMALHAYSGCDSVSAFKGIGKVKPIKILQQFPKFAPVLASLGDTWEVSEDLISGLEEFTCAMYGKARFTSVNELRYFLMHQKCTTDDVVNPSKNFDMGTLPPNKSCLEEHIKRANYQAAIWKRAHITNPDIPDPADGHGWIWNKEILEPLWFKGDVLPTNLADIVQDISKETSDEEDILELEDIPFLEDSSDSDY